MSGLRLTGLNPPGNDLTLANSSRTFLHFMSKRTLRMAGALGMLLLFTAQATGWCRAYVCDCSGVAKLTTASHCHDSTHEDAQHEHASDFGEYEGDHEHGVITVSYSAPLPQGNPTLPPTHWIALDLPQTPPSSDPASVSDSLLRMEHDPGPPRSRRHRHTLAMLI